MCTGIKIILKDASQHGVVVPNNRYGHYPLCKFLANPFICCCNIILLQPELIENFPRKNRIFSHSQGGAGALSLSECNKH